MAWQFAVFGETFRELDCSPAVAERIEDATQYRWDALESLLIGERREAKVIRRTAAALLADRLGLSAEDAFAKVDGLTIGELMGSVTEYQDDLPTVMTDGFPQSADEPSTSG